MSYADFLARKVPRFAARGVDYRSVNDALFPFQGSIVDRALQHGRFAVFADCGLGKTLIELEYANNTPGRALLLAPLAVGHQIEQEAQRFGYDAAYGGDGKICISNYERLHQWNPDDFDAIILDESSILKAYDGKTRNALIEAFANHRFRLCCTATPSPNDIMELGNHSEFLGVKTRAEMLAMFFVHDGARTSQWRVKGHAKREFWRWVGSWCAMVRRPSDLGFSDVGYHLPPLTVHRHPITCDAAPNSRLIPGAGSLSLHERRRLRQSTINARVEAAADLLSNVESPCLYWCGLNAESDALKKTVDGSVAVAGADTAEHKRDSLLGFANGHIPHLITKPRIGGWGMNWQVCSDMAFVGLSDSYEEFYQSTRRCWRFGQDSPVDVHIVYSEHEEQVIDNVMAKEEEHKRLQDGVVEEMKHAIV